MSSSRGSSWLRDRTCISWVSCIEGRFLTHWAIRALGWALIHSNQCLYTKRNFKQRGTGVCTHIERICWNTARRQSYASQGERLQENPNLLTPWPWPSAFRTVRNVNTFPLFKPPSLWYFVMAALANECRGKSQIRYHLMKLLWRINMTICPLYPSSCLE